MDSVLRMPGDHCMWCVEPSDEPCQLDCRKPPMWSPQGEDHEPGIEAMARVIHPRFDEYAAHGQARWLDEARDALAAYLARVSAPKADEKQEASQDDERRP